MNGHAGVSNNYSKDYVFPVLCVSIISFSATGCMHECRNLFVTYGPSRDVFATQPVDKTRHHDLDTSHPDVLDLGREHVHARLNWSITRIARPTLQNILVVLALDLISGITV